MFHAEVGNRYDFEAIFVERIRAKPMLKRFDRSRHFLKMFYRDLTLVFQNPVVQVQLTRFAVILVRKVHIVSDVHVDAITIDRVGDDPVERFLLVFLIVRLAFQPAVGNRG